MPSDSHLARIQAPFAGMGTQHVGTRNVSRMIGRRAKL